jgi:hypothetical protein
MAQTTFGIMGRITIRLIAILFLVPVFAFGTVYISDGTSADVQAKHDLASDGDTITAPAGTFAWSTTVNVTKNISFLGKSEGETIIVADTASTSPLISVVLDHEASAPDYSFRMSGFTLKSANLTEKPSDNPYIKLASSPAAAPTSFYVHGCVSRIRLDHMTWDKLNGLALLVNSCLGVADHITADNGTRSSSMIKVFMANWTPTNNPATDTALPSNYLATDAYGSWADDSYFGTDKFWFFEDCNFTVSSTFVSDDEEGGRAVYRHCTVNNGTGFASHGMEGRRQPGVRAREIYNNYFITTRSLAQARSGSTLYFNNKSTDSGTGITLKPYRFHAIYNNWGGASGDNRYDQNPVDTTPIVTGTIDAVQAPGDPLTDSVTVSESLSAINLSDGSMYIIQDTDDPFTVVNTSANGWKYNQSGISGITGQVISLTTGTSPDSAEWQVGHHYQIRKVSVAYGMPGTGKGNLLNISSSATSGYSDTWSYPATSGALAQSPQAGYDLDPCYSWNNTDDTNGYLGFSADVCLKAGTHYSNLSERTIAAQNVGYPAVSYARATNSYPNIGPGQTVPYAPYTYPHPLTTGATPTPTPTPTPTIVPVLPKFNG